MKISLPFGLLCGSLALLVGMSGRQVRQRAEAQDHTVVQEQDTVEPITVYLASGRSLTAQIDSRTDASELWLRWQRGPTVLRRPVRWERVTRVQMAGEQISGEELRHAVVEIREAVSDVAEDSTTPTLRKIALGSPESTTGSAPSADAFGQRRRVDRAPRVRSLEISAAVANWDADVTVDGLIMRIHALDGTGASIPVRGSLQIDLRAPQIGVVKRSQPFGILGRWTRRVRPEDFGPDGAVYRLPFQRVSPEFDLSLAPHGAVHAKLSVPGHGTFEATESTVRIRPASPVRDQLQQATGRRFFPGERTGGDHR